MELPIGAQGTLWIGTWSSGLNQYDRTTESFSRYRHDPDDPHSLSSDRVRRIYEDRSGNHPNLFFFCHRNSRNLLSFYQLHSSGLERKRDRVARKCTFATFSPSLTFARE